MIETTDISKLSATARLKGQVLYYSLVLHVLNSFYVLLSQKTFVGFHVAVLGLGIFFIYRARPANIQNFINNWASKGSFPFKTGSALVLRVILTFSFIYQIYSLFEASDKIDIQKVVLLFLSIPFLVFIFDKEIEKFIWQNPTTPKKSIGALIFYGCILILPYGCAQCAKSHKEEWTSNLKKCVERGHCMNKKTMNCEFRDAGDPKLACELPPPTSETK